MRDAVRVALLARPGAGGDRLREALRAAGAELVLDADPTTLEPETLAGAGAESVVVVLDAAVEEALDRLDPVLHDPAIDVLYEESDVAAAREGWDVARWSRHLSAKLLRHSDVLPPGREPDSAPVAPLPRAVEPLPTLAREPVPPAEAPIPSTFDPVSAEYDPDAFEPAEPPVTAPEPTTPESDAATSPPGLDWGTLELTPDATLDDASPAKAAPTETPEPAAAQPGDAIRDFRRDLAGIEQRIASMGLVDADPPSGQEVPAAPAATGEPDATLSGVVEAPAPIEAAAPATPAAPATGAVLVFAGIGGPDAVRQFLGALPEGFPRPVLIHQRLDGGRHDRLVQQMARATSLPVQLAADNESVAAGHVYILPPGLGLASDAAGLRFVAGGDPMATLPPGESAVLMFSGSDTALVDAAMDHARAGALVAGQSPEDCYDAAAADALVARGAESGQPADLARRLAERWAA